MPPIGSADQLGRDVRARVIVGARDILTIAHSPPCLAWASVRDRSRSRLCRRHSRCRRRPPVRCTDVAAAHVLALMTLVAVRSSILPSSWRSACLHPWWHARCGPPCRRSGSALWRHGRGRGALSMCSSNPAQRAPTDPNRALCGWLYLHGRRWASSASASAPSADWGLPSLMAAADWWFLVGGHLQRRRHHRWWHQPVPTGWAPSKPRGNTNGLHSTFVAAGMGRVI